MSGPHPSRPQCHGSGRHVLDAEQVHSGGHADDVGDRVPGTHLVEVDVVDLHTVHPRLGLGEQREDRCRDLPDRLGDRGAGQQVPDVGPGALRLVLDEEMHLHVECPQAGSADRAALESDRRRQDGVDDRLDLDQVGPRVHQSPQQHVAGDARARVDPQVPAGAGATRSGGRRRRRGHGCTVARLPGETGRTGWANSLLTSA